jgi:hypothetical protein
MIAGHEQVVLALHPTSVYETHSYSVLADFFVALQYCFVSTQKRYPHRNVPAGCVHGAVSLRSSRATIAAHAES